MEVTLSAIITTVDPSFQEVSQVRAELLCSYLAVVAEVKDSLRASLRVLLCRRFSPRPTSRSSLAPVPLGSTLSPPILRTSQVDIRLRPLGSLESPSGLRAA